MKLLVLFVLLGFYSQVEGGGWGGGYGGGFGGGGYGFGGAGWGGGWGGGYWSPWGPGALGYWGQGRSRNMLYNPYFANTQMIPYKGATYFTKEVEKPEKIKYYQPVVKYVYVKEPKHKAPYKPSYSVAYDKDEDYDHYELVKPKSYRKKRSVLLPKKEKYSIKPMMSKRFPSYFYSFPGWYLSPHYYYSKAAYENSLRKKFFNRKLKFNVDKFSQQEYVPEEKPYYGSNYNQPSYEQSYNSYEPSYGSYEEEPYGSYEEEPYGSYEREEPYGTYERESSYNRYQGEEPYMRRTYQPSAPYPQHEPQEPMGEQIEAML